MKFYRFLAIIVLLTSATIGNLKSQSVIDQVVAIVGGERVLLSNIEQELHRMKMQGAISG